MFEDLIESYKLLPTNEKRKKLLDEIKIMIAISEQLGEEKGITHREINSKEILDVNDGQELEDDYLEALFVYIEYLKESMGSLIVGLENLN